MSTRTSTRPIPSVSNPSALLSLDAAGSTSSGFSTPPSDDGHSPSAVSVKFAPLPKIGPRERKPSTHPLGVAARQNILQQRRDAVRMQGHPRPLVWSDVDVPSERFVPIEVQEEDPLEVLGRLIAHKSKSLWRRATSKANTSKSAKVNDGTRGVDSETATQEEETAVQTSRTPSRDVATPKPSSLGPPNQTSESSKQRSEDTARASFRRKDGGAARV
jgi:hypothetical protein